MVLDLFRQLYTVVTKNTKHICPDYWVVKEPYRKLKPKTTFAVCGYHWNYMCGHQPGNSRFVTPNSWMCLSGQNIAILHVSWMRQWWLAIIHLVRYLRPCGQILSTFSIDSFDVTTWTYVKNKTNDGSEGLDEWCGSLLDNDWRSCKILGG